jgi:hypothetical protein
MWDEIIKWSGWGLAIGMVVWRVVDAVRNRTKVKFFVGVSKDKNTLNFVVINTGRRPVNLIRAGLQYPDGTDFDFPPGWDIQLGQLYNMQMKFNSLSLEHIKESIRELDAPFMVNFIYVTDERGHRHRVKIPSNVKDELYS